MSRSSQANALQYPYGTARGRRLLPCGVALGAVSAVVSPSVPEQIRPPNGIVAPWGLRRRSLGNRRSSRFEVLLEPLQLLLGRRGRPLCLARPPAAGTLGTGRTATDGMAAGRCGRESFLVVLVSRLGSVGSLGISAVLLSRSSATNPPGSRPVAFTGGWSNHRDHSPRSRRTCRRTGGSDRNLSVALRRSREPISLRVASRCPPVLPR